MKLRTKKILATFLVATLCLLAGTYLYINKIVASGFNLNEKIYIYIDENKSYEKLLTDLQNTAKINDIEAFKKVASFYDYPQLIKTGRYEILPDMNVIQVVNLLKGGHQAAVNLKFNNIRTKNDLAQRISQQLMISEDEILIALNDSVICANLGFTTETIATMFIPNTYQVYWDASLSTLLNRMKTEFSKFWNEERLNKAGKQGLTATQVSILASIVEEECYFRDEYPMVAGLYLNRLKRGQLLQADPTVKFAVGDFTLKRILFKHLEVESPYNTYRNIGLPPGPIRIPSISGIDAVLSPKQHNYLYMCAKEDFSGRHNFAVTHGEHQRNAAKYRNALNSRGIYK